jgi:hypothetical protein
MPLLGNSPVARRRMMSWRGLVISLACLALIVSLASRTIHLSAIDDPIVQPDSPKAKIQHLVKDAVQWTAPVASFLLFWVVVICFRTVSEENHLVSLHLDTCLYNRPPPLA